ncbi:MAG: ABC transporter ATP-binding protein [Calditrichaceae bacterium]
MMLSIKNLSITYDGQEAVKDVTLSFRPGKLTGLIGQNGAGKSSLLKAAVGLISGFVGTIGFNGMELNENRFRIKQICGYAPEDAELLPYLTGREFLELIGKIRKTPDIQKEIEFLINLHCIKDKADELVINYSHGMKQKLSIAAALIGKPDFLILDEALNGLDPVSLYNLKNYLTEQAARDKTVIISSHILPLIRQWCDPVIILKDGRVMKILSASEITEIEQSQSFESYFVQLVSG